MIRSNRHGLMFEIHEVPEGLQVTFKSRKGDKSIIVKDDRMRFSQAWYNWQFGGQFIQQAFSHLSNDEREFFMTGLLPLEFEEATKEPVDADE